MMNTTKTNMKSLRFIFFCTHTLTLEHPPLVPKGVLGIPLALVYLRYFLQHIYRRGTTPPQIFAIKSSILMIWILKDRYESCLSIDTKNVPVALRLTSQWRFDDVTVTKKTDFTDFC